MLTKLEILEETFKYYNEDVNRRAVKEEGGCEYLSKDGRMCAFGRCMINPGIKEDPETGFTENCYISYIKKNVDSLLKEEYRGHENRFWSDIQSFHDSHLNWEKDGISLFGKKVFEDLKARWSNK